MYPETYNPSKYHPCERWRKRSRDVSFECIYCEAHVYTQPMISGVLNRNHCPYCLSSRHVDHAKAGDRMSACKAVMQPIGLTIKPSRNKYGGLSVGELMLIHRCSQCGKLSINRLAADDLVEKLMELFYAPFELDPLTQQQLAASEIHILQRAEWKIVVCQLLGAHHI